MLYKEEGKERWAGPAKVTGIEGNKVRVIDSGYNRTVPKCRVMPVEIKRDVVIDEAASTDEEEQVEEETVNEVSEEETKEPDVELNKIEV